jgi:3'(2'), 5'-bisphosphate nucleotidase
MVSDKPLTELVDVTKQACEAVTPMLLAFYDKIRSGEAKDTATKLKNDATYFSIADGIVQHMFIEYLFKGNKFGQIVGEEDGTQVNIKKTPYTVDDLEVPSEFNNLIYGTLSSIKMLAAKIDTMAYKDITVFVDPIDGTREFATGQGDKVTILVGYNDKHGHPVAGVMYRPLTFPNTWAIGAKSEGCARGVLNMAFPPVTKGVLVTDGKVSTFLSKVIDEMGYERINSLASGNRAMMLLEGKAGAYIRDTGGFAKWDTSGPQVLKSHIKALLLDVF